METFRPFVAAVLGLMLCVQGLAVAAAPVELAEPVAAAETAMDMPCQGDEAPGVPACDCCDDACSDMMGCATGSVAGTPFVSMPVAEPLHAAIATRGWSAQTGLLTLPVRPPIVAHA